MKRRVSIFIFLFGFLSLESCTENCTTQEVDLNIRKNGNSADLFNCTIASELGHAVYNEQTNKIKRIVSIKPSLLKFKDNYIHMSILEWAVYNEKYKSAEALLKVGADPNLSSGDCGSAFMTACKFDDSKYLLLLLKYGGDVNACLYKSDQAHVRSNTPLRSAIGYSTNFENIKILLSSGANINYTDTLGSSNLYFAFDRPFKDRMEVLKYLITYNKTDLNNPLSISGSDTVYIVNELRKLDLPLNSTEYNIKMEIVDYLKKKGIDYQKAPIPKYIKEDHANDKEYLEKY